MRPWRKRITYWLPRLGVLLLSAVVILPVVELVVRVALPQQLVLVRRDIWQPHDGLGWRRAPDLDTTINTGEGSVRLLTDGHGNRIGASSSGVEATTRVLALGDSFIAALQVEYEQTVTGLLERSLSERVGRPIAVVDTGVAGYGPSHYLIQARRELREHYDLVLVFLFLGNDIEERRVETFGPKRSIARRFRLPRSLRRSEIMDAVGKPADDALESHSQLFVLAKNRLWPLFMRLGLSARAFPEVLLRSQANSTRFEVTADICAELAEVAASRGVPIRFVFLPSVHEVEPEIARVYARSTGVDWQDVDLDQPARKLRSELERHRLLVLDTIPDLRRRFSAGEGPFHGIVDTHLNRAGHQAAADYLGPLVAQALERSQPSRGESLEH